MVFDDWHPPIMSLLWAACDALVAGPALMFAGQVVALFGSLVCLARSAGWTVSRRASFVVVCGLVPPTFVIAATILKDTQMALALLLATILLQRALARRMLAATFLALLLLFYGTAVRHNAVFATLPLCVAWLLVTSSVAHRPLRVRSAFVAAVFLSLAMLGGGILANRAITRFAASTHIGQSLYWFDLAGIAARTGANVFPVFATERISDLATSASAAYDVASVNPILFFDLDLLTADPAELSALADSWRAAVRDHPSAYLSHRFEFAGRAYGLIGSEVYAPFNKGISPNDLGVSLARPRVTNAVLWLLKPIRHGPFFRGWPFLLIGAASLVIAYRRRARHRALAACLVASSTLYVAAFIFIGVSADFRFMSWSVVAAFATFALALGERERADAAT